MPRIYSRHTPSQAPDSADSEKTPLDQVIEFCKRGMAQDLVKDYIESPDFLSDSKSSGYKFNFGKDPLRLSDACGANAAAYQRLIRARFSPATAPKPAAKKQ